MTSRTPLFALLAPLALAAGCTGDGGSTEEVLPDTPSVQSDALENEADEGGLRLISPEEGAALQASPPADLVILDVRTPEEFAEGHLEGAVLVDFYDEDFADQLAGLDPDVPYLLYCRSGNRSGQTLAMMSGLGFADVADVDGGIVAWTADGHALIEG